MSDITPITEEQITKAVEWWANSLERPKFDNGDPPPTGGTTMALAMMAAAGSDPQAESLDTFKCVLADKIRINAVRHNLDVTMGVDYHPDLMLSEAANEAGISDMRFSWKTQMWITRDGRVRVSQGYAAPIVDL